MITKLIKFIRSFFVKPIKPKKKPTRTKEQRRAYYLSKREDFLNYQKEYRKANPEASNNRGKKYYAKNREKVLVKRREKRKLKTLNNNNV